MATTTTRERAYLQQLRKRRKLSQEQLAARLGVSRNTVGRMETGKGHTDITTVMHTPQRSVRRRGTTASSS